MRYKKKTDQRRSLAQMAEHLRHYSNVSQKMVVRAHQDPLFTLQIALTLLFGLVLHTTMPLWVVAFQRSIG